MHGVMCVIAEFLKMLTVITGFKSHIRLKREFESSEIVENDFIADYHLFILYLTRCTPIQRKVAKNVSDTFKFGQYLRMRAGIYIHKFRMIFHGAVVANDK